jgi:hypothetical protein
LAFCTSCGRECHDGEAFCRNCGSYLERWTDPSLDGQIERRSTNSWAPTYTEGSGVDGQYRRDAAVGPFPSRRGVGKVVLVFTLVIAALLISVAYSPGLFDIDFNSTEHSSSHTTQLISGNYNVSYSWVYPYNSDREWTINVKIPATTYDAYSEPAKTYDYASYVTKDDPIVDRIATELNNMAKNNSFDTAQFVLSFVQNVPYGTDENTTTPPTDNYPRYPDETLVDGVGDCKDHTTLYASLMESPAIGTDMVLLVLTKVGVAVGHMAAGIDSTGYGGTYVQYHQVDYFYCETTSAGWKIGQLPPEMKGYSIQVLG